MFLSKLPCIQRSLFKDLQEGLSYFHVLKALKIGALKLPLAITGNLMSSPRQPPIIQFLEVFTLKLSPNFILAAK